MEVMLRDRVEEDVEVRADVEVGALEGPRQRKDEGDIFLLCRLGAGEGDGRGGAGGEAAGERCVVVDVEFEEMEEGVGDRGDGAIYVSLDAVLEVEGETGLFACCKGDVFELVAFLDVFTCLAGGC